MDVNGIIDEVELEDDLEIFEILRVGFPRQIHERFDAFGQLDDLEFYRRYRITKETCIMIVHYIEDQLEYPYNTNNSISPLHQLLIAILYYASGSHQLNIGDVAGATLSSISRIVKRVSIAIAMLAPRFIKFPGNEESRRLAQASFFRIAAFPKVIGCIDGTHIKIRSPGGDDAEIYRNRKQYFSINVQAISDANMNILDIVARWPGSSHDATIFNNSRIRTRFENREFPNCVLLGDSAYNLRNFLLTPLLNPAGEAEQRYNEAHIRTRGVVEKLFGIWKRRFPVLAYGCRLKLDTALTVIVATAVLHNICQNQREANMELPPLPPDFDNINEELIFENNHIIHRNRGDFRVRREIIDNYFAQL